MYRLLIKHALCAVCLAVPVMLAAGMTSAVASSSAQHASGRVAAQVVLTGQVRDGRILDQSRAPKVVVPYGLPAVAGAVVALPQLGLRTVSSKAGNFSFRFPAPRAVRTATYTLVVRKRGLGSWQESGIVLTPGNAESIYVQMMPTHQRLRVTKRVPQPYNGGPIRLRRPAGAKPEVSGGCPASDHSSTWYSQNEPPMDIRVYFPSSGQVLIYNFVFYQEHTLPNEWIPSWDEAALEAGAVAVRDYAWYFVVNGSKGTPDGHNPCAFDVDNTTDYENFVPGNPTYASTNEAVNTTISYLFTHGGDIPETSFNSGAETDGCGTGEDTNGTAMSQWGSQACAADGDDFQQILGVYYYPGYSGSVYCGRGPGAASDVGNDNQYVFFAGLNANLYEAYYNGSSWTSKDLGMGPLGSEPAAAAAPDQSTGGNQDEFVFWKGSNGELYEAYWTGSWHGPKDLGYGPLASEPTVGVDANGNEFVFWEGSNGNLYEAYFNGSWHGPEDLGYGRLASSPTVAVSPVDTSGNYGDQYVFWQGSNGNLYEAYWNGSWHGPIDQGEGPLGSPPSAATDFSGNEYVFWSGGDGGNLYENYWIQASSSWTHREITGQGPLRSSPSVDIDDSNHQFVFWRGTNANIYEAYWNGSWHGPIDEGQGPMG